MDKEQLQTMARLSAAVSGAMSALVVGLLVKDWIKEEPWITGFVFVLATVAVAAALLWLYSQVRLIRWTYDPKCPRGMFYEYEPVPATETEPPGMRYRFDLVFPGSARAYEFRCNTAPVEEIEVNHHMHLIPSKGIAHREPIDAWPRRGKTFEVDVSKKHAEKTDVGLEIIVRADKEIYILRVKALNSAWYRLWERLKWHLRVESREPAGEPGED